MHALQVKGDGLRHVLLRLLSRSASSNTTWQVGRVGGEPCPRFLDDDQIPHFRPACFSTLFNVPGARSSFGLPAMVTTPGFSLCLNWRWLPLILTTNQPSAFIIPMTALTFIYLMIFEARGFCKERGIRLDLPREQTYTAALAWFKKRASRVTDDGWQRQAQSSELADGLASGPSARPAQSLRPCRCHPPTLLPGSEPGCRSRVGCALRRLPATDYE